MNKILLVDPYFKDGQIPPNVPLGKIESQLKKNKISVDVIDFNIPSKKILSLEDFKEIEEDFIKNVIQKAKGYGLVYITTSFCVEVKPLLNFPRIKRIIDKLKEINVKNIFIGGATINHLLEFSPFTKKLLKKELGAEIIVGDELNIIKAIKKILDIEICLYDIPIRWDAWDFNDYPNYASILVNIGCPYKCNFCFEGKIYNKCNYNLSFESLKETIKRLKTKHGINKIMIEDSVFISPNNYFEDFCLFMKNEKIQWMMYARVNEIIKLKKKLKILKKSGCEGIIIGIETPRENLLEKTNKLVKLSQIKDAISLLKKEGIAIQGTFLLAFYEDTLDNVTSDIAFGKGLNIDHYRWHILQESFDKVNKGGQKGYNYYDYLDIDLNLPDNLLPELLKTSSHLIYFDEHFLIRCIPYLKDSSILRNIKYKNFNFEDFFKTLQKELADSSKIYNEEEMNYLIFK